MTLRIAWFASARGNSSRLLFRHTRDAIDDGRLNAQIVCAFCNREPGQSHNTDRFLNTVDAANIPLITRSSLAWRKSVDGQRSAPGQPLPAWRRDYDQWIYDQIAPYRPDIAMLAGYMLVVTDALCDRLPMLNLHPALPDGPIGTWQQVVRQLIADDARESGMMLQRVTTDLDRGPIVACCRYPIRGPQFDPLWRDHDQTAPPDDTPLFNAIRAAGVAREPTFIVETLAAIADGRTPIPPPNAVDAPGIDLTSAVEQRLSNPP